MDYTSTRDGITVTIEEGALDARPFCYCLGSCPDCQEVE